MDMRMDPVDAAAKVISRIADWAREKADGTVATVGYVEHHTGGNEHCGGYREFTVDIRSRNNDNINDITNRIRKALERAVGEYGGSFDGEQTDHNSCGAFRKCWISWRMRGAGLQLQEDGWREAMMPWKSVKVLPQSCCLCRAKDGRSHCPVEFTKYSDLAKAAVVMEKLAKEKVMK